MKLAQKSFLLFLSKLIASVLGFIATIYFARTLGAEILGYFAVTTALISWLQIAGNVGISNAVSKRVSEDEEWLEHASAGFIFVLLTTALLSMAILIFNEYVNRYVGVPVSYFVAVILSSQLLYNILTSIINGRGKVHIAGILQGTKTIITKAIQASLVFFGLKLSGLLIGYWFGIIFVGVIGMTYMKIDFILPKKRHFRSLWNYAKFSWLGGIKGLSFNSVDILVLGMFVPSSLVGIYSVAWSISKFLSLFDAAISQTIFPEISYADAKNDPSAVANLVTSGIRYAGLITIPGVIGAHLLGGRLLRIYGPDFEQGTTVLALLALSVLLWGYQKQLLTGVRGIDRPDLAFRINIIFIGTNLVLNFLLIYQLGWVGGAIATVLSSGVGVVLSAYTLNAIIELKIPYVELAKQVLAALAMGGVVFVLLHIENQYYIFDNNLIVLIVLVAIGATSYFTILLLLSSEFRDTLVRNIQ